MKPDRRRRLPESGYANLGALFNGVALQSLSIADNASLSMADIDFEVAGWAYFGNLGTNMVAVAKGDTTTAATEYLLHMLTGVNRMLWEVSNGTTLTAVQATTFGALSPNLWYFINAYHDSVNNLIGVGVNGSINTAAHTVGSFDSAQPVTLGARNGANFYLTGLLDSWGVWKRLLTTPERAKLYNNGQGLAFRDLDAALKASLQVWWDLDGNGFDASGNGNHLTNNAGVQYAVGKR